MQQVIPAIGVIAREEILFDIAQGRLVRGCVNPSDRARGCSFDLTVGTIFWNKKVVRSGDSPDLVVIPPGGVVGIFTSEELILPDDVCGTAFAINEMSSKGFLVLNPGHVDPGFIGPLSIKALNVRKTDIAISCGDPIFTLIFQRLDRSTTPYKQTPPRLERERQFNAESVQSSPSTISSMIELDKEGPFPSRAEVKELIRGDTIGRATLVLAFLAFAAAVVAVMLTWPRTAQASQASTSDGATLTQRIGFTDLPPLRQILGLSPCEKGGK